MSQTYLPHPLYRWLTLGCLLLTAALGWNLLHRVTTEVLFFFVICVGITLWFANNVLCIVQVRDNALVTHTPLRGTKMVEFRQVERIVEGGRLLQSLSLLYHPQRADGLLDLDVVHHLMLPALTDQQAFQATVEAHIPK